MPQTTLPFPDITQDLLVPILYGIWANMSTILPIGVGLFSIFLGIRIIPGVISRLFHT
ncbi:hypothetical protein [Anaerotruncus sp.]|uniref:hypothetical protein n=1 Tax=Anaerotruncus TaxID=244127 RepID=UPI00216C78B2|nr:hypothetical protein [Anaerotruncus sp.]MCI8493856.1 hypothetical protein [Anaerotruncus sp.]